ncbi:hypothetical protein NDU88_007893 [Pleurodeles waltl]|uniref:Uncharacterized protein n=1 Tax=Pleurodeles waltl TaxID=8319 RepID=A0AAV7N5D8_PLEWA|nr:hypothetical protein NDU88_007893 [Pleurodeles waltl]
MASSRRLTMHHWENGKGGFAGLDLSALQPITALHPACLDFLRKAYVAAILSADCKLCPSPLCTSLSSTGTPSGLIRVPSVSGGPLLEQRDT